AAGFAMGAKLDGTGGCAIAYFGEGGSSQGEVHEAMNFASVFELPVVFFCQNNQWAISVPASRQVGGGSVAARAAGYGLAGAQVDGNDVVAVYEATAAAIERGRSGGGATVIEALTYRLGPHATSDDPARYRSGEEEAAWREREPLVLARRRLLETGEADQAWFGEVDREVEAEVELVRARVAELVPPPFEDQLALVFERPPASALAAARAWLDRNRLGEGSGSSPSTGSSPRAGASSSRSWRPPGGQPTAARPRSTGCSTTRTRSSASSTLRAIASSASRERSPTARFSQWSWT